MKRSHPIALAGVVAALLCNYWVLEGLLAERTDPAGSWISDLATRSESFGWRFIALGFLAGVAVAWFALLLLRRSGRSSPTVRHGILALLAAGLLAALASAAPLSCAEGLETSCSLSYDALDIVHSVATVGETAATALAFLLLGLGLARLAPGSVAGRVTLALGALWLALTALTGLSYLSDGIDSIKGLAQRADQVVFGAWLVLLGVWIERYLRPSDAPE